MPNSSKNHKNTSDLLRNLKIVYHRDIDEMSYDAIAEKLAKDGYEKVSRQKIHSIYQTYKDVSFKFKDGKAVID